jgi:hypothetical protein
MFSTGKNIMRNHNGAVAKRAESPQVQGKYKLKFNLMQDIPMFLMTINTYN